MANSRITKTTTATTMISIRYFSNVDDSVVAPRVVTCVSVGDVASVDGISVVDGGFVDGGGSVVGGGT